MSYKPIAPAPSSTPGSSTPGPGTPVPTAGSVPSPSGSVPGAAAPFRPLFNDFGPPSMGYVQAMKPPGAQGSQSTYTDLLSVIEEMGKEIRPTYAGSKSAMERLKREHLLLPGLHPELHFPSWACCPVSFGGCPPGSSGMALNSSRQH
ncbi:cyclin-dependent kinase 2-associated protein 2 isoform X1 [Muntiacus reevesi]|uniref:cyclin-dependent kinase 2-associated protein 2 isoform X1 n=1 Tax=Muntiacus reevesi TaxID=9886 RepID=UPI003307163A